MRVLTSLFGLLQSASPLSGLLLSGLLHSGPALFGPALFGLLLVGPFMPAAAQAACAIRPRADIELTLTGTSLRVPLEVNGQAAIFVLDTGAQRSVVTPEAAARLGLARDEWVATTMRGVGGVERNRNANPRSLTLAGIPLQRRTVSRDTSLTVATIPQGRSAGQPVDGLLGRDFLGVFDLDLDMPARRLRLYDVAGCAGRFLPWTSGYTAVPVANPAENALVIPVELDGHELRALLDTGAGTSLVAAPGIAKLDLTPARLAGDATGTVSGVGPRVVVMHHHRFAVLRVGNERFEQPLLWVSPVRLTPITDMLLGMDWLMGKRVWISYSTSQVFIAGH